MSSPETLRLSQVKKNLDNNFAETQDLKDETGYLPVFARLRPLLDSEIAKGYMHCVDVLNETIVRTEAPLDSARHKVHGHNDNKILEDFSFTRVFDKSVDQYELFHLTVKNTVQGFINKQNSLVFAYGNTGSGKTHTMQGTPNHPGVIPMTMKLLFDVIQDIMVEKINCMPQKFSEVVSINPQEYSSLMELKKNILSLFDEDSEKCNDTYYSCMSLDASKFEKGSLSSLEISRLESSSILRNTLRLSLGDQRSCSIWVSFIEIYNERVFDLLQPFTTKRSQLKLGEDMSGNTYVKGLKEIWVINVEEVLQLLQIGQRNLKMAATKLNYQSSRSHCIFTIKMISFNENNPSLAQVNSISFCDLAGSERCSKTENTGLRLKEASHINISLMVLGRCIKALRENKNSKDRVIPFRESKLTRLVAGFFTGKGKASMLVNISPSSYTFDETLNVLKFSALAQKVTVQECPQQSFSMVQQISADWGDISRNLDESNVESDLDCSNTSDVKDQLFEELCKAYRTLEKDYIQEKTRNNLMEMNLRKELAAEFNDSFSSWQAHYEKRIQSLEEKRMAESYKRMQGILHSIQENAESEEESEDSEESDDEKSENTAVADVEQIKAPLKNAEEKLLAVETEKESIHAELIKLKEELLLKDEQINHLIEKCNTNEASVLELKVQFESKDAKQKEVEKELASKVTQLNVLNHTIETLTSTVLATETELKEKNIQLEDMANELGQEVQQVDQLNEALIACQSSMRENEAELKRKSVELENTKEELIRKNNELLETIHDLESKEVDTVKEFKEKASRAQELQDEKKHLVKELQASHMSTKNKLNENMIALKSANEEIRSKDAQMKKLEISLNNEMSRVNTLVSELKEAINKMKLKDDTIEKISESYKATKTELQKMKVKHEELSDQLEIKASELQELQIMMNEAISKESKIALQLKESKAESDKKACELQQLKLDYNEAFTKENTLASQLKEAKTVLDAKIIELQQLKLDYNDTIHKENTLTSQLKEAKAVLDQKTSELQQLKLHYNEALNKENTFVSQQEEAKRALELKTSELEQFKLNCNEAILKQSTTASQMEEVKSVLEEKVSKLQQLQIDYGNAKNDFENVTSQLEKAKIELEAMASDLHRWEGSYNEEICKNKETASQLVNVKALLETKDEQIKQFQLSSAQQQTSLIKMENELKNKVHDLEDSKKKIKAQEAKMERYEHSMTEKYDEEKSLYLSTKTELESQVDKLKKVTSDLHLKDEQIKQFQLSSAQQQTSLIKMENELKNKVHDLEDSKKKIIAQQKQVENLELALKEANSKERELHKIESSLEAANKKCVQKEEELEKLKHALQSIESKYVVSTQDLDRLSEELKALKIQQQKASSMESEMAALKMEIEVLKLELDSRSKVDSTDFVQAKDVASEKLAPSKLKTTKRVTKSKLVATNFKTSEDELIESNAVSSNFQTAVVKITERNEDSSNLQEEIAESNAKLDVKSKVPRDLGTESNVVTRRKRRQTKVSESTDIDDDSNFVVPARRTRRTTKITTELVEEGTKKQTRGRKKASDEPECPKKRTRGKKQPLSNDQGTEQNSSEEDTSQSCDKVEKVEPPVAFRRITRNAYAAMHNTCSPLQRITEFVSEKASQIKAAVPLIDLLTPSPQKKRKLFSNETEPELTISPVPDKPESPMTAKKATSEIQKRINYRSRK